MRIWLSAILLLSTVAQASDRSSRTAQACAVLQQDASAERLFPGGKIHLCADGSGAQDAAGCRKRTGHADCIRDVRCLADFSCANPPCPPEVVYQRCVPRPLGDLATLVLQYAACRDTVGEWIATAAPGHRYPGACSCMGPQGLGMTQAGIGHDVNFDPKVERRLFVRDRGCVNERAFCKENGGTWIAGPFSFRREYLSRQECLGRPKGWFEPQPVRGGFCVIRNQDPSKASVTRFCSERERGLLEGSRLLERYTPSSEVRYLCQFESASGPETWPASHSFCRIKGQRAQWISLGLGVGFLD